MGMPTDIICLGVFLEWWGNQSDIPESPQSQGQVWMNLRRVWRVTRPCILSLSRVPVEGARVFVQKIVTTRQDRINIPSNLLKISTRRTQSGTFETDNTSVCVSPVLKL
jgi:hypothetical protein